MLPSLEVCPPHTYYVLWWLYLGWDFQNRSYVQLESLAVLGAGTDYRQKQTRQMEGRT